MRAENERGTAGEAEEQEVAGVRHRPQVNQRRSEPVAGSSHHAGKDPAGSSEQYPPDAPAAPLSDASAAPDPDEAGAPGKAVRDMMGGPPPQGDVPDAPATQIAATDEERKGTRVAHVANAVPGQPDGEVDTRGGYTGS
jgi:hypothetical protein